MIEMGPTKWVEVYLFLKGSGLDPGSYLDMRAFMFSPRTKVGELYVRITPFHQHWDTTPAPSNGTRRRKKLHF